MAHSLICADSGMDCPGQFQTKTEDELMKHVELHVGEAHPDLEMTPENVP
jgi:predicted small metal-binding protein